MTTTRRETLGAGLAGLAGIMLAEGAARAAPSTGHMPGQRASFGLAINYRARPGKGADLMRVMGEGLPAMEGSLAFLIAADEADPDSIWVMEYWIDKAAHERAIQSPAGLAEVAKGQAFVEKLVSRVILRPA
jgi:quinol monooxygenase YgiN